MLLLKGFKGVRQLAYPCYIINTLKERVLLISGIPDTLRTEEEPIVRTLTHHWMSLLSQCQGEVGGTRRKEELEELDSLYQVLGLEQTSPRKNKNIYLGYSF